MHWVNFLAKCNDWLLLALTVNVIFLSFAYRSPIFNTSFKLEKDGDDKLKSSA